MNIFVSDTDPIVAGQVLDDRRTIKMILETAQMVSTVAHLHGVTDPGWYNPTHTNHPCVKWAATNDKNLIWLVEHGEALAAEYTRRFGKVHKSLPVIERGYRLAGCIPIGEVTPFVNCTTFKGLPVVQAYRQALCNKWSHDNPVPKWTKAEPPTWFVRGKV